MVGDVVPASAVNGFLAVLDDFLRQLLLVHKPVSSVFVQHLVVVEGETAVQLAVVRVGGNQFEQDAVDPEREHAEGAGFAAIVHDILVLFQVFECEDLVHHAGNEVVEHDILLHQHDVGFLVVGVVVAVAEGLAESEGWRFRMIDTWQNDILRLRERIHVLSIVVYTHPLLQ